MLELHAESQFKFPQNLFDKVITKLATTLDSLHEFSAKPMFNGRSMFILDLKQLQLYHTVQNFGNKKLRQIAAAYPKYFDRKINWETACVAHPCPL